MKKVKKKLISKMTREEHAEEVKRLKIELKKAKAKYEGVKETLYIFSSYEGAKDLLKGIEQLDAGKGIERDLEL